MKEDFIKIINETYRVISFFPDSEPLKNRIKSRSLSILENLTLLSSSKKDCLDKNKAEASLFLDIEILESYLKLARQQGLVDNINLLIILKEYSTIKNLVKTTGKLTESSKEDSLVSKNIDDLKKESKVKPAANIGLSSKTSKANTHKKLSERQNKILKILTKNSKAQVSDIIRDIPDVTKRTIRRDLDDLLKKGIIVRAGEWNQVFYRIPRDSNQSQMPEWQNNSFNRT